MNHPTQDELVLHYYGDPSVLEVDGHIQSCDLCRDEYRNLQRLLNTFDSYAVPERPANYGTLVWEKLQHNIPARRRGFFDWMGSGRQWAVSCALAVVIAGAFFAGRYSSTTKPIVEPMQAGFEERVLLTAVGNHLDRSQMVLVDFMNAPTLKLAGDHSRNEQAEDLQDLLDANRLYRSSAVQAGEGQLADVLDELERLLVEVAHLAPKLTPQASEELRQRIQGQGILLKVRLTGSEVRERERTLVGTNY